MPNPEVTFVPSEAFQTCKKASGNLIREAAIEGGDTEAALELRQEALGEVKRALVVGLSYEFLLSRSDLVGMARRGYRLAQEIKKSDPEFVGILFRDLNEVRVRNTSAQKIIKDLMQNPKRRKAIGDLVNEIRIKRSKTPGRMTDSHSLAGLEGVADGAEDSLFLHHILSQHIPSSSPIEARESASILGEALNEDPGAVIEAASAGCDGCGGCDGCSCEC